MTTTIMIRKLQQQSQGMTFPQRVALYMEARRLMFAAFEKSPKKARQELAQHDRDNPDDRLSLML